jgi:hypothetical protein
MASEPALPNPVMTEGGIFRARSGAIDPDGTLHEGIIDFPLIINHIPTNIRENAYYTGKLAINCGSTSDDAGTTFRVHHIYDSGVSRRRDWEANRLENTYSILCIQVVTKECLVFFYPKTHFDTPLSTSSDPRELCSSSSLHCSVTEQSPSI